MGVGTWLDLYLEMVFVRVHDAKLSAAIVGLGEIATDVFPLFAGASGYAEECIGVTRGVTRQAVDLYAIDYNGAMAHFSPRS
jgi:hypothetical protein